MRTHGFLIIAALAFAGVARAQLTLPYKYSVTYQQAYDLGTLGGSYSTANDINDGGDIVGTATDGSGKMRAFIRLAGQGQMLALDDGSWPFVYSQANGISNSRVVVGNYTTENAAGFWRTHGFYYYPGIWMTEIESNAFGMGFPWEVVPTAINNLEYIVGYGKIVDEPGGYDPPDTTGVCYTDYIPLFWNGAGQAPFGLNCYPDPDNNNTGYLGTFPHANDINDSNWVVGADGGNSTYAMFLRKGVQVTQNTPVPRPSGSPSGKFGEARGINNSGRVVGSYGDSSNTVAFYWDGVAPLSTSLGHLPGGTLSYALEINEQNMVVGYSDRDYVYSAAGWSGFIYHPDFGMVRLKAPGEPNAPLALKNCKARAANNRKSNGVVEVVGECVIGSETRAVVWAVLVSKTSIFTP